jgi:hypothetical protein
VGLRFFVYPAQTFHKATQAFHEQEVLATRVSARDVPKDALLGKCAVLGRQDFCLSQPLEVPLGDTYVCLNSYTPSAKAIHLIKHGPPALRRPRLRNRKEPVPLRRIAINTQGALLGAGDRGGLLTSATQLGALEVCTENEGGGAEA